MYVTLYCDESVRICSKRCSIDYRLINSQEKRASMDKPAIHSKYINSSVTGVLGKANHRPYCADEVILTRSDDLVQPTIG